MRRVARKIYKRIIIHNLLFVSEKNGIKFRTVGRKRTYIVRAIEMKGQSNKAYSVLCIARLIGKRI